MATVTALDNTRIDDPLAAYRAHPFFCELLAPSNRADSERAEIIQRLRSLDLETLAARASDAEHELFNLGITFTVYTNREAIDRILPFDVIPRVIGAADWRVIETGVTQRVAALNALLWDIYHDGHILNDGTLPRDLIEQNPNHRPEMHGYDPPCGTYVHIAGTDIVRDQKGTLFVLEDNGRTPSGVS